MKMKNIISGFAGLGLMAVVGLSSAHAEGGTVHYPLEHPKHPHWSFAGPFGHWDLAQLQRGLKVYREVCSACHSMKLVAFRDLRELGYNEEQVKTIAKDYEIEDGPNGDGEMFTRAGKPSDYFPSPFPNEEAAASANNGAAPPDFSLLAKARAPERGFPNFVLDIFTQYAENGPDYIYSLLTGYDHDPADYLDRLGADFKVPEGAHFNPYFVSGPALAMAHPLSDGLVTYDDGSPETVDQYAHDISAFMMWAAEPTLVERKSMGFRVMIFLVIFASLLYLSKKVLFADLKREEKEGKPSS